MEPALNKALSFDPDIETKLQKLDGKSFSLELTDIKLAMNLRVLNRKLLISTNTEGFDCLVRTSLDEVRNLSDASVLTKLIKQDKLELEGDLSVAQGFSGLIVENQIDWQEFLSKYLGDGLSHKVSSHLINFSNLIKRKSLDMDYTLASALTDELRVTPDKIEIEQFIQDVDKLTGGAEKLIQQVNQLKGSL